MVFFSSPLISSLIVNSHKWKYFQPSVSHFCNLRNYSPSFDLRAVSNSCTIFFSTRHLSNSHDNSPNYESCPPNAEPLQQAFPFSPRTRTPLEKQFETWIHSLKPGFSHHDVETALRSQSDPDLSLDIFRWTAQQRNYSHNAATYQAMIEICIDGHRRGQAETLMEEVVAGACAGTDTLYNTIIRFCCSQRHLFNRAFDIFKKMQKLPGCKPTLETYTLLLNCLLRRFNRLNVSYVYLHAVRSLLKQMKASGVIPDTFTLNLIIKAYSKCLEMDEALRVFREMGLYGCEPNNYTYSYLAKGFCEKGRIAQGVGFYKEMRKKGLVPTSSTFMILICSLAVDHSFEEATEVMFDMLANSMVPDLLTFKTLLEELCRGGREDDAFQLLEQLGREAPIDRKTYSSLSDALHVFRQE